MPKSRILFFGIATILITAIGLIIYGQTRPLERTFHGKLAEILPAAPPGWTRSERPIADSPEMKQKVDELLSYDDGVFYDYTKGNLRLSVYVAYWGPGKMSSRLVAGHTPDVCWVGAGWVCTARSEITPHVPGLNNQVSPVANSELQTANSETFPAQARTFTVNTTTEYVWFWHLVNGMPLSYHTGKQSPWYAPISDILKEGINQRSEQFFIRLSSPQQLDDPALSSVLNSILMSLPLKATR